MKKRSRRFRALALLGENFYEKMRTPVSPKFWIALLVIGFSVLSYFSSNAIGAILAEGEIIPTDVIAAPDNFGTQPPAQPEQGQPGQYQPRSEQPAQNQPVPMNPADQNQPGQAGPPNQATQNMGPQMGQPGPTPEQQAQIDQQRLDMMKKGMSNFLKEMTRVKKNVASYEKKGMTIPEDLKTAIAQIDSTTAQIKNAATPDELQDIMSDFQESLSAIQEWMPKLPRLAQLPKLIKQADKELAKAEKSYAADAKKITKSRLDLADILSEFRTAIDQHKELLAEIKNEVKTDPETAMDKLTEDFFGALDNVWESDRTIQTIIGLKSGLAQMQREQKQAEKTVASLKKKKIDTAEAEALLAEAKTQISQIKTLAAAKPIDYDAITDAISGLMDIKQEFADNIQELTGGDNGFQPQLAPLQNFQMNIPQGFDLRANSAPPGGGSGPVPSVKQPINGDQLAPPQTCNVNGVEMPGKCEDYQLK